MEEMTTCVSANCGPGKRGNVIPGRAEAVVGCSPRGGERGWDFMLERKVFWKGGGRAAMGAEADRGYGPRGWRRYRWYQELAQISPDGFPVKGPRLGVRRGGEMGEG